MFVQVVHLFLARQLLVACQRDDLHTRSHHKEGHVETDLIVASTCRAVCDGIGADLVGITGDGDGLEDALAAHRNGVAVVAEHISEDHVFQRLLVILLCDIECHIFHGAQLVGVLFVGFQLFGAESAGIGACRIDLITVLCEFHYGVGSIETSRECDDDFLLVHCLILSMLVVFMILCYLWS